MAVPAVQTLAFFSRRTHRNREIPGLIEAERPNTVDAASRSARRALLVRAGTHVFANAAPVLKSRTLLDFLLMATVSVGTPVLPSAFHRRSDNLQPLQTFA